MRITQPFSNHNGGDLLFGGDGYLYITLGDGGSSNDADDAGQAKNKLLGKILRIDVDSTTAGQYGIPSDNPFTADSDYRPEIFSMGLRNPWRCSFDSQQRTKLYCGDVGQNRWEEVDVLDTNEVVAAKGANLGNQLCL
jgi:glucose/arabinose dehydrogenase